MYNKIDKWADRVYSETDFGRSIATSVSGIIGLVIYLIINDWVIAAFSSIITFPIVRIISTSLNEKINFSSMQKKHMKSVEDAYHRLSNGEKEVIQAFVTAGGTSLTYSHINSLGISAPAVETLIQREIIWSSMTADGMRETFALDTEVFDIAQKLVELENS
ncbi:hypothetical protein HUE87_07365 [Candidatus Sulfurimonas marisnigri]|uniref:Uncharacterized protein n=1 Tax=Candidatus Sulfurimonas marisnigri TaxID=2740405 RepID=A0A7S7LYD0_9BACT|nr:hypothetical protein [Candidatus Sulfurimonas marisnigri]QOY53723.1 hypothetical protein HUE87_07365 [Candidatus Sulfurimonas marisnigri]